MLTVHARQTFKVIVYLRQVVDLLLCIPRIFVLQREDLDGHHLVLETAFPDSPEPSSGLDFEELDVP